MRALGPLLQFLLWIGWVSAMPRPSDPAITPPPSLGRRETPDFVGYYETFGYWEIGSCMAGYTWSTSSPYGGCVKTRELSWDFNTACFGAGTVLYPFSSYACSGFSTCNTYLVYQTAGDEDPLTWVGCRNNDPVTLYRTRPNSTPAPSQTSSSLSIASSASASQGASPHSISTVTTSPTIPTPSAASTGTSNSNSGRSSKTWLIGPVVGGIAAIVIAGLGFWICVLKKRNKKAEQPPSAATQLSQHPIPPQSSGGPPPPMSQYSAPPQSSGGPQYSYYGQDVKMGSPAPPYQSGYVTPTTPVQQWHGPWDEKPGQQQAVGVSEMPAPLPPPPPQPAPGQTGPAIQHSHQPVEMYAGP